MSKALYSSPISCKNLPLLRFLCVSVPQTPPPFQGSEDHGAGMHVRPAGSLVIAWLPAFSAAYCMIASNFLRFHKLITSRWRPCPKWEMAEKSACGVSERRNNMFYLATAVVAADCILFIFLLNGRFQTRWVIRSPWWRSWLIGPFIKIAQRNPVRNSFASCNLKLERQRICCESLLSYDFISPLQRV